MLEAGFLTIGIVTGIFEMLSPIITSFLQGPARDRAKRLLEEKKRYAMKLLNSNDSLENKANEINSILDNLTNSLSNTNITRQDIRDKINNKIQEMNDKSSQINKARNDINTRLNQINEYNVNEAPRDLFELASSNLNDEKVIDNIRDQSNKFSDNIFKWKEEYNEKF